MLSESSDVRIGTHLEKWDRKFTISSVSGFIVFFLKREIRDRSKGHHSLRPPPANATLLLDSSTTPKIQIQTNKQLLAIFFVQEKKLKTYRESKESMKMTQNSKTKRQRERLSKLFFIKKSNNTNI